MSDPLEIDTTFQCKMWDKTILPLVEKAVEAALGAAELTYEACEISLVFADDHFVQTLNKDYRGKDKPTNVLSFPQMEAEEFADHSGQLSLGDIILAFETIKSEAEDQNKPFEDHLTHLIIHGTLHLLGYDHIDDEEAEEMEALEIKILATLGVKNPYVSDQVVA